MGETVNAGEGHAAFGRILRDRAPVPEELARARLYDGVVYVGENIECGIGRDDPDLCSALKGPGAETSIMSTGVLALSLRTVSTDTSP